MDGDKPIVAFGQNTSIVHYFPQKKTSKKLENNALILLDVWGRLKKSRAPYADMTMMFYIGKQVPLEYVRYFNYVCKTRDAIVKEIKLSVKKGLYPVGKRLDTLARMMLKKNNVDQYFLHGLGHSLGTTQPHGIYAGLRRRKSKKKIVNSLGYTIEPGLYVKGKFGVRSEIDFYIDEEDTIIVTTPVQNKIQKITNKPASSAGPPKRRSS
jgi:Xaa-Pro dipeptidase